jgi:hypothetical protein
MTGKEMCEYIAKVFKKHYPNFNKTAEEIWNISPKGELGPVFDMFMQGRLLEGWTYSIDNVTGNINWIEPKGGENGMPV